MKPTDRAPADPAPADPAPADPAPTQNDHYLKKELYELVRSDPKIFEFFQDGSLDGIWYWDLERPENEWLSPRFKDFFGFADEEMEHSPDWWKRNIDPADLEAALQNFEAHKADPSVPYDQVVRYRHRDGSSRWVRCRGIMIRDNGVPKRMLGAHTDVTPLKLAEKSAGRARDQLSAQNEELERILRTISHDLRAPLRSIRGFGEMLLEEHEEELSEEAGRLLSRMVDASSRMHELLRGLLRYAEVSRQCIQRVPVDLQVLLTDVVSDLNDDLRKSGGEVRLEPLPTIVGDPKRLYSLFINLLENAIKYRSPERAPRIRVSATKVMESYRVSVADNGIGLQAEHLERATDLFVQLHPRGEYAGVGIGLSLCARIIELHGSVLEVEEEPEQGTTFSFRLPAA